MSVFPLLQLPHLPLLEILKQTGRTEIAILSLTSKKAEMLIRAVKRRISFASFTLDTLQTMTVLEILKAITHEKEERCKHLQTTMYPVIAHYFGFLMSVNTCPFKIYVDSIDNLENHEGTRRTMKIEGQEVPMIMKCDGKMIMTFWKDAMEGWMSIGDYLKDNLGLTVSGIRVKGPPEQTHPSFAQKLKSLFRKVPISEYRKNLYQVVDWTREHMIENHTSSIKQDENFSSKDYNNLLSLVKSSGSLTIDSNGPFQNSRIVFSTQKLVINASWFRYRHLLKVRSEEVHLKQFKIQEINRLLAHWVYGGKLNFRVLSIDFKEIVQITLPTSIIKIVNNRLVLIRDCDRSWAEISVQDETTFKMRIGRA